MYGVKFLFGVVFEIFDRIGRLELIFVGFCMVFCSYKFCGIVIDVLVRGYV